MADKDFIDALEQLTGAGFRKKVMEGTEDLRNSKFKLKKGEPWIFFICGIYCGHIDIYGRENNAGQTDEQRKFNEVLNLLITNEGFRNDVENDKEGKILIGKYGLNPAQINILYELGEGCGHLKHLK